MKLHKFDWLDWLTILLCLWFFIYPSPYKILFTVILLLPIIGLILKGSSKPSLASLITITINDKGGTDYEVADFIVLPALIILLRMFLDFELDSLLELLIKGLFATAILLIFVAFSFRDIEKENNHKTLTYFVVLGNLLLYSFGVVYGINCVYDKTKPKIIKSEIVDKSIYSGKRKSYYLQVEPLNKSTNDNKIRVPKYQYEQFGIGDSVNVVYKQGLLNLAWHYIE